MAKELLYGDEAWKKLAEGVDKVANAVKITVGPRGHNVVLSKTYGSPTITNDGVTIAKEISLEDNFENMGAQLMIEVASKANEIAGDGTTSATILGQAIFKQGLKSVVSGSNAMAIKRGIVKATDAAVEAIKSQSKEVGSKSDIAQVASVSANNDPVIGDIIAEAMDKVGNDGVITVEESKGMDTYVDVVEGMQFDKGYMSPYFVTNKDTGNAELDGALVLVTDKKISNVKEIIPILEKTMNATKPLLLIAEDIDGEALATLVVNKLRGTVNVVAVKAPSFGDTRKAMLEDIATVTKAKLITGDLGATLDKVTLEDLGSAKKITVSKESTTIIEGAGTKEEIDARIAEIRTIIDNTDSDYDKQKAKDRLAKLSGGVAVIHAGATTETELKEKQYRIEDALSATRAAVEEGIVPGGGVSLVRAIASVEKLIETLEGDEQYGAKIVKDSLVEPLKQIATNAGFEGAVVAKELMDKDITVGFNAMTLEYVDMYEAGIVDPVKVVRSSLQNAASIAGMLLTTGCIVAEKKEENQTPPGIPAGAQPMM